MKYISMAVVFIFGLIGVLYCLGIHQTLSAIIIGIFSVAVIEMLKDDNGVRGS